MRFGTHTRLPPLSQIFSFDLTTCAPSPPTDPPPSPIPRHLCRSYTEGGVTLILHPAGNALLAKSSDGSLHAVHTNVRVGTFTLFAELGRGGKWSDFSVSLLGEGEGGSGMAAKAVDTGAAVDAAAECGGACVVGDAKSAAAAHPAASDSAGIAPVSKPVQDDAQLSDPVISDSSPDITAAAADAAAKGVPSQDSNHGAPKYTAEDGKASRAAAELAAWEASRKAWD